MFNWRNGRPESFVEAASNDLQKYRMRIQKARQNLYNVEVPESSARACVTLSEVFHTEGHRADYLMVLAARACAALEDSQVVELKHLYFSYYESLARLIDFCYYAFAEVIRAIA